MIEFKPLTSWHALKTFELFIKAFGTFFKIYAFAKDKKKSIHDLSLDFISCLFQLLFSLRSFLFDRNICTSSIKAFFLSFVTWNSCKFIQDSDFVHFRLSFIYLLFSFVLLFVWLYFNFYVDFILISKSFPFSFLLLSRLLS